MIGPASCGRTQTSAGSTTPRTRLGLPTALLPSTRGGRVNQGAAASSSARHRPDCEGHGHPCNLLPGLERPLHGRRAPVRRQQRGVDVDGPALGDGQERLWQDVPVRGRDADVRLERLRSGAGGTEVGEEVASNVEKKCACFADEQPFGDGLARRRRAFSAWRNASSLAFSGVKIRSCEMPRFVAASATGDGGGGP